MRRLSLLPVVALLVATPAYATRTSVTVLHVNLSTAGEADLVDFTVSRGVARFELAGVAVECPLRSDTLEDERGRVATRDAFGSLVTTWHRRRWHVICGDAGAGVLTLTTTIRLVHGLEVAP